MFIHPKLDRVPPLPDIAKERKSTHKIHSNQPMRASEVRKESTLPYNQQTPRIEHFDGLKHIKSC